MANGIRIDELNTSSTPSEDHVVPAMKDGQTVKLTVGQILDLLREVLDPDEVGGKALFAALNLSDVDDPEAARENLGATEIGDALFTAEDAAAARGSLGATTVGHALFTAEDDEAARQAVGATEVGDALFTAANKAAGRSAIDAPLKGHLFGLTLSNSTSDSDHDLDIAAGEAASDSSSPVLMSLASGTVKRMDAAFTEGTGSGGMVSGESLPTSGTIHVWLIAKDDGTTDVCANNNASSGLSPSLPPGFTHKRRIASLRTDASANILSFRQTGDQFDLINNITDANSVAFPNTNEFLVALSVPNGLTVSAMFNVHVTGNTNVSHGPPWVALGASNVDTQVNGTTSARSFLSIPTNATGQIKMRGSVTGGGIAYSISTWGWIDTRGRQA